MILYADTSALVPLVIEEPSSPTCSRLWSSATRVVSCRIWYAEARAAIALARRLDRIDEVDHGSAVSALDDVLTQIDHVEITPQLVVDAGQLADEQALRGFAAVHLAAARAVADDELVVATGDRALGEAVTRLGIAVALITSTT